MNVAKIRIFIISFCWIASILLTFGVEVNHVKAYHYPKYWVVVVPITGSENIVGHSCVGWEWTITFQATWGWGEKEGQVICNATIPIQVEHINGSIFDSLSAKTDTTGQCSFNYTSHAPQILKFVPIKLITQDGVEWDSRLHEIGHNYTLYGFYSQSFTIYWDEFVITILNVDTNQLGISKVIVNVNYSVIPPEGVWTRGYMTANPSSDMIIPKYVQNANVKINGIKAYETSPGIYEAQVSTWMPTSDIYIEVSQSGWPKTVKTVSLIHNANQVVWVAAVISFSITLAMVLLYYFLFVRRKPKRSEN